MISESGTFRDPLPIVLTRSGVLPWTIVVWSPNRLRFYLPGIDYIVTQVGGRTVLLRNFLGAIPFNGTVSIDYLYHIDNGGSLDSQRVDFRMQQEFNNGFTPYYDFEFRHDDRDQKFGILRTRDFESNRHRLGLRYRKDRFNAGAELEILKDAIDPFVAYRLHAASSVLQKPNASIDLRADFSQYFFERSDRGDTMILELAADGRAAFNRHGEGYLTSTYRYEDDGTRGRGVIHGVDLEGGLSYQWGLFTVTASVEYDLYTIDDTKEDGMGVFLKVRRDFPNLLGTAR